MRKIVKENEVEIFVPFELKTRRGQQTIIVPKDENVQATKKERIDQTLLTALVKAFVWQQQLMSGKCAGMKALCQRENMTIRSAQRLLRLNVLSPRIKELILTKKQLEHWTLSQFMEPFPLLWEAQEVHFGLKKEE